MHPLGKGLSVAVLLFAIAGYVLMAGVMQKRGDYSTQVETQRKTLVDRKAKLATEKSKSIDLQRRLLLVNANWKRVVVRTINRFFARAHQLRARSRSKSSQRL